MGVYFVFTIDGDWDKYFRAESPIPERLPDAERLTALIKREIAAAGAVNGRFLHFVHSSPVTRDFFLRPEFISLWRDIVSRGGNVGVHCHEEESGDGREDCITPLTRSLREKGLDPVSYRGGYLSFSREKIPLLEKNGLSLDFSCDPGRFLKLKGRVISDWRGAPGNFYRLSYEDHRRPGKSMAFEIPLGKAGGGSLYIDITSLTGIWKAARSLAAKGKKEKKDIVVSALSHTYEFSSFFKRLKIKLALAICKRYGTFLNDKEVMKIIGKQGS